MRHSENFQGLFSCQTQVKVLSHTVVHASVLFHWAGFSGFQTLISGRILFPYSMLNLTRTNIRVCSYSMGSLEFVTLCLFELSRT